MARQRETFTRTNAGKDVTKTALRPMEERGILMFTVSTIRKCVTLCSKRGKAQIKV